MVLGAAIQPASILGPVVGVLLVSSEWSQRTAQITFALVPRRARVIAAKLLAGLAWCVVAFRAAWPRRRSAPPCGVDGAWNITAALVLQDIVYVVISVIGGIAFGAALLASAPAIVLYFVLPIAWSIVGSLSFLEGAARWLDSSRTSAPMIVEVLSGTSGRASPRPWRCGCCAAADRDVADPQGRGPLAGRRAPPTARARAPAARARRS